MPLRRLAAGAAVAARVGLAGAAPHAADGSRSRCGEKTGGATTVFANGRNAFSFPAANLSDDERTRFVIGNSFFRRNWVQAPASTQARDGLGPHFIARSCGGCHVQDGRGAAARRLRDGVERRASRSALLMRLSVPGRAAARRPSPSRSTATSSTTRRCKA